MAKKHIIVIARAGTGKTFTDVEGANRLMGQPTPGIVGTDQQEEIWDAMKRIFGKCKTIAGVAFNKSISIELSERMPDGVIVSTMHSMGLKAVTSCVGRVKINGYRTDNLIEEITGESIRDLRKNDPEKVIVTKRLVSLCKTTLCEPKKANLDQLVAHYDLDVTHKTETYKLVKDVYEKCKDVKGEIDFDDMIWLPVILDMEVTRYDALLVDEAQDLNRCQQELVMKFGKRLMLVGDPKQAIYGFAGADTQGMERMQELLEDRGGVEVFPLTKTRRCPKKVVDVAQKIVEDFEAMDGASEGTVDEVTTQELMKTVKPGDMMLCRVNAPMVSWCFKLLKAGHKATIQGRDIGQGIIRLIQRLKANDVVDLTGKLSDWYHKEMQKENNKRNPSEARQIALDDKYNCILSFSEGADSVDEVVNRIETIFSDNDRDGIKLSSIHRAKGLEAQRVFILHPELIPHPMAKTDWAKDQEKNLRYVAVTRAMEHLTFVVK